MNSDKPSRLSLRFKLAARLILSFLVIAALPVLILNWLPGSWLLAAAATLALTLAAVYFITGRVSRPLELLSEAAHHLETGDGDSSLDLELEPEIGPIAKVINDMVVATRDHAVRIEQRTKELQALVNLSDTFLGSMEITPTMESAMNGAMRITRAEAGVTFLVLKGRKEFQTICINGLPEEMADLKYPMDAHTASGYAMLQRKAIVSSDVTHETRFHVPPTVVNLGIKSTLAVPMLKDGQAVGCLTLASYQKVEFNQEEIDVVQAIANHTAVAIDRIKLVKELSESYNRILVSLVKALDTRDRETEGHSQRVVAYSRALADAMGVDRDVREEIERGALLHDIGKIGVPDAILHKTGSLSDAEWDTVRKHPIWGKGILEGIGFLSGAAEIVLAHHEHWNGEGYPNGLQGEQIPLGARIFAVADAFDAMTSYRPYRDPQTFQKARDEIRKGSGNQFDPQVVDAFLKFNRDDWTKLREEGESGAEAGDIGSLRRIGSGQLQAMNLIVAAITSSLDLNEVLQQSVKVISSVTRAAAAGVYLLDAKRGELKMAAGANLPAALRDPKPAEMAALLGLDQVSEGVTQFHANLREANGPLSQLGKDWESALILALQDSQRSLGALVLLSITPNVFSEDERLLFDHVAKQLSQAITNARLHEKVRVQAVTDALTGAYNRHYLNDFLNIEVKRCQRYKRPLAILMLDMDHFKDCNEAAGHQAGDKALQDVVHLLNLGVRSVDLVTRYGGEEFLIVLPETDVEGALEAAERMRRLVEKHQYPCGRLTASLGVAACSYEEGDAPGVDELIARADKALFESKKQGKNKVSLWNAKMQKGND